MAIYSHWFEMLICLCITWFSVLIKMVVARNWLVLLAKFIFSGHNTDGKYFITCNKLGFHCETAPKRIVFFIEKAKDGHITPVEVVEIIDFSCGSNHTVSTPSLWYVYNVWYFIKCAKLAAKARSLQSVFITSTFRNIPVTSINCWHFVVFMSLFLHVLCSPLHFALLFCSNMVWVFVFLQ